MPNGAVRIRNVGEYATHIDNTMRAYRNKRVIFRGQSLFEWELIPSVFRPLKRELDQSMPRRVRATNSQAQDILEKEKQMLEEFKMQAIPYLSRIPQYNDNWEWLALARHHNLPTRLLDWTEHAAAGLFFAVQKLNNGNKDSSVWCAILPDTLPSHINAGDPFNINQVHFYQPPHITARITVQRSCFTVHPTDYLVNPHLWATDLIKIEIPSDSRSIIRESLKTLGIHKAALFPDLDGIATHIKSKYAEFQE